MKMKGMKMAAVALTASLACAPLTTFVGTTANAAGQTYSLNGAGQHKGTGPDGYSFEIWAADTNQPSSMTLGDNGTFSTTWNCAGPSGNFLARRGIDMGSTKKFQEYNGITCDFDVSWSSSSSGNSRLCIYGWTRSPLVEYYIVEDWANWCPPNGSPGQGNVIKQFSLDGSTYYIYKENRNSYTIDGNQPFVQYYSVRQQRRQSGTIHVSDHFEQWESAGLQMGVMYEVAFNVEGWESNGQANVKKNTITLGDGGGGGGQPVVTTPVEPDANGYYLKESFESGAGDWTGRGGAKVAASSGYDGSKGVLVSGRTDNWNGASISLSSNPFAPSETFAFGTAVMQDSESSVDFKLTLQYTDSSGTEKYDEVKTVTAPKGQWVDLSNSSYTIPTGASNMVLYVEAPESLTDFYLDGAYAGVKGTKPLLSINQSQPVTEQPTTQPPTTQPPTGSTPSGITMWGDTNLDNTVELSDAILIMQHLANPNKYSYNGSYDKHLTKQGALNGDVYENGSGLSSADALSIQKKLLNMIPSLPESYLQGVQPVYTTTTVTTTTRPTTTTTTTTAPKPVTTTTTTPPSSSGIPDKGTPMNANATMVSDFRTGNAGDFFASDGWTNGQPFDCWWYKRNAVINNGALELSVDQKWTNDQNANWNPHYSGGEFRTNNFYHYGYYECSMQAIKNDGVVSSFFTYTGESDNNPWDEIDIEVLGKDTTKVQFNYYTNGQGKHEYMYNLGFDASEAYHTYGFDWQPNYIAWYVDGREVYRATQNIPQTAGKIMMNAWPGLTVDDWLKPFNGRTPLTAHYQWVTYNKNGVSNSQNQNPNQGQTQNPWQDPNQVQNQNPNQGQNQNPNQGQVSRMNKNATMVSDFTTGNAGDFFASDGWTNGKPFDCWWYKQNAVIENGLLRLSVDRKWTNDQNANWNPQYSGGEFRTNNFYHYGYYETEMKAIKNDGVVSSFFTYTGESDNNPWDEIDIEILGKDTTKVQFNYYTNGQGDHEYMYNLGFDASQDFHTYGFEWQPNYIAWYVDGKEVYRATQNIPQTAGKIMMNAWPGRTVDDWLKAYNGNTPLNAYYKWVTYNKQ